MVYCINIKSEPAFPVYFQNQRRTAAVLEQIREKANFPGETLILSIRGDNYRFGRKFRWLRGAGIA